MQSLCVPTEDAGLSYVLRHVWEQIGDFESTVHRCEHRDSPVSCSRNPTWHSAHSSKILPLHRLLLTRISPVYSRSSIRREADAALIGLNDERCIVLLKSPAEMD